MCIRAAFIGINRYHDDRIRDLNGCVRDATALWSLFSDTVPGIRSTLLVNGKATSSAINIALQDTLGQATDDDIVVLSFSGHGSQDHKLVPADANLDDLASSTIDMNVLAEQFRTSKAKIVLCFLDCCFSGKAPARVLDEGPILRDPQSPLPEIVGRGRILLAASGIDEPALEDPSMRHGLLTYAVVDQLTKSSETVSVATLVEAVMKDVRAAAAKFGYTQTPTLFGQIEGELTLPALRRGPHFNNAFPELVAKKVGRTFTDLAGLGIEQTAIDVWSGKYPSGLNDLQLAAVNDHRVLNRESLIVVAPTSAGKTFIGEIAGIKAISEGRKVVFLLPYRALVNEKYLDFSETYADQMALRVIRCSGDWQDQVGEFLRGKYDIAFLTYEKFLGLSLASPHILHQIGLVVIDEVQFIMEETRGITVELLLTNLVSAKTHGIAPQVVALSAVIGHTNSFERWLGANLLTTSVRPVPLIEGVLDRNGQYVERLPNGKTDAIELLPPGTVQVRKQKPGSQDVIVPLVRELVQAGEKVIIFRNTRGRASGCAAYLANELGLTPADDVLELLPERDLSNASERLREVLGGGVAFHSSNLTREERSAIEEAFRDPEGKVRVLVATTTVAAGVNTPASTVIIVETEFYSATGPIPFTVAQYKNMAGRAGRLGYETEGKSVLIADTPIASRRLFQTYVEGAPEQITSSFDPSDPATWLIRLLTQVSSITREQALDLVSNTYGGFLAVMADPDWQQRIAPRVDTLIDRMLQDALLELINDKLNLTMLGRACGESPLGFGSALQLVEQIRTIDANELTLEGLMALIQALPELDADYTPMGRGSAEAGRPADVRSRFGPSIQSALRFRARSDKTYHARCKRALILGDWIDGTPIQIIEDTYTSNPFNAVGFGDVRGFADQTRFLLEPALRIAAIVEETIAGQEHDIENFLKRLELGVPEAGLVFLDLPADLTRGDHLAILQTKFRDLEEIQTLTLEHLSELVGRDNAQRILGERE